MADYKSMYYTLLRAQLKAIGILQNAQLETEKMFSQSSLSKEGEESPPQSPASPLQK